jgi:hypothetical protein
MSGDCSSTDFSDRVAHDARDVDVRRRRDLARDVDLAGDRERLARDAALRILREDRVEHGVGDLIGELVGMPLGHRLRGEQTAVRH